MVVNGEVEFVGSDSSKAQRAIAAATRAERATVRLQLAENSNGASLDHVRLLVRVDNLPPGASGDAEVLLAITEDQLRSNVSRGENAGRKLTHSAVVRLLAVIGSVDLANEKSFSAEAVVRLDRAWQRDHLRAVAFVQEQSSRRVLGAAEAQLAAAAKSNRLARDLEAGPQ